MRGKPETTSDSHTKRVLAAYLEAAWLRRCGPSGAPGRWMIPGEVLPVDDGEVEVDVCPTFAHLREDGSVFGWSSSMGRSLTQGWEWRLGVGWDDCTDEEVEHIEALGGCFEDRSVSFHVLGSHDEKPPIPPEVVQAMGYLTVASLSDTGGKR